MCFLLSQCRSLNKTDILRIFSRTNYCNVMGNIILTKTPKEILNSLKFNRLTIHSKRYNNISITNPHRKNGNHLFATNSFGYYDIWRRQCTNTNKKDTLLNADKNVRRKVLENVIEHNKEKFRETEQRLREKSNVIMQDIKATKDKMKERMEVVIERENIYTIPNFLCVSRIAIAPYLGMLIVQSNFDLALAVLGLAALTDLLDGWIARTWKNQSSKVGSFLDPMADKILIATLFVTLTYNELIPLALTGMIITRDVILVAAGFVIRYRSLPPPRTLARYFDASHATAQLAPTFISKANTAVQLLLVGSTLAAPVFHYVDHPILQCLWYITGATTIAAGLSYVISKDTYKYLRNTSKK